MRETHPRVAAPSWLADRRAATLLRGAAVFYLIAFAIHTGDHVRRGLGVETTEVATIGIIASVTQLVVIATVFLRWRWAAIASAIVGFIDGAGIAAVHLLPHWSAFSDAFPGSRGTGVTAFSWFAALLEVAAAVLFGIAGLHAWRASSFRARQPGGSPA